MLLRYEGQSSMPKFGKKETLASPSTDTELLETEPSGNEDASPRRAAERRYLRDFIRPSRGQLIPAILLFVTALLITWTWRSQQAQPEFAQARQADLVQLLDSITSRSRAMEEELRDLERTHNNLANGRNQADLAKQEAQRRIEQLNILAGTVPASGPGIEIRIYDPQGKITAELMLNAVQELRDAGAEVLEINEKVRIVSRSFFTMSGGKLTVDGIALEAPYLIRAIGDPGTLEAGARFRGGLVSEVEGTRVGGEVGIKQLDQLRISATVKPVEYEFARPR